MTELLTQSEVCRQLRVSPKTLQLLRRARRIDYMRLGHRTIRFTRAAVEKFMKENSR